VQVTYILQSSNDKNARQLFFGSVVHLPVLLALMMIHKINYQTEYEEVVEEE
jgi:protoheme IX farnesyltransferase